MASGFKLHRQRTKLIIHLWLYDCPVHDQSTSLHQMKRQFGKPGMPLANQLVVEHCIETSPGLEDCMANTG